MTRDYLDITKHITVKQFQAVAAAILKEGDRRFYCNRYNNSPHYKLDHFDLYLDPIDPYTNFTPDRNSNEVVDYNTIVIQDHNVPATTRYYRIILEGNTILLKYDDREDDKCVLQRFLNDYLPALGKLNKY